MGCSQGVGVEEYPGLRRLGVGEVHLIPVPMVGDRASLVAAWPHLSKEEQTQALGLARQELRDRFVITRAVLRRLLVAYLGDGAIARKLEVAYGGSGKPYLCGAGRLRFNLSHSGSMALYAFCLDAEIGVDIEKLRPVSNAEGIARRFFCAEEAARVLLTTGNERSWHFLHAWTRLEANVKAKGGSIEDVFIDREGRAQAESLRFHQIEHIPGYIGTVAYAGVHRPMQTWPPQDASSLLSSGLIAGGPCRERHDFVAQGATNTKTT